MSPHRRQLRTDIYIASLKFFGVGALKGQNTNIFARGIKITLMVCPNSAMINASSPNSDRANMVFPRDPRNRGTIFNGVDFRKFTKCVYFERNISEIVMSRQANLWDDGQMEASNTARSHLRREGDPATIIHK